MKNDRGNLLKLSLVKKRQKKNNKIDDDCKIKCSVRKHYGPVRMNYGPVRKNYDSFRKNYGPDFKNHEMRHFAYKNTYNEARRRTGYLLVVQH